MSIDVEGAIPRDETLPKRKDTKQAILQGLKDNLFTILTLIGVAVGFGIGFGAGSTNPTEETILWIKMPGKIYIRVLQLSILPVIAANIIIVMAEMDPKKNGKVGIASMAFVLGFDLISGAFGVVAAVILKPGKGGDYEAPPPPVAVQDPRKAPVTTSDVFKDLLLNIFPENVVGITLYQEYTTRQWEDVTIKNVTEVLEKIRPGANMIGLIFTAVMFGLAAGVAGKAGRPFVDFFRSLSKVLTILMRWFLLATPIGVCFMVAGAVVELTDVGKTFASLGLFVATVLVGLAAHMILQMAVYAIASFRNPFSLMLCGAKVWFLSFITTAPVIAIPDMLAACDRYGIRKSVSRFVIPFSAVLKGDGAGIFQAVACVFVAQRADFELTIGSYVVIAILTGFATLAIPNVPSGSIFVTSTILASLEVPVDGISLLFALEWFVDRCRSGSIGIGHMLTAGFTHSIAIGRRTEGKLDDDDDDNEGSELKSLASNENKLESP